MNGTVRTDLPILVEVSATRSRSTTSRSASASRRRPCRYYFLMNKPKGVYSTNVAQGEQVRAIDLLPPDLPARVYPVGRLDADSKGLLLLTNDGDLTNQPTHPRYGVAKTYRAMVDGFVSPETIQELEKGVWMADPRRRRVQDRPHAHQDLQAHGATRASWRSRSARAATARSAACSPPSATRRAT